MRNFHTALMTLIYKKEGHVEKKPHHKKKSLIKQTTVTYKKIKLKETAL